MKHRLRQAYALGRDVIQEFGADRGTLFAAAISFFGLISLIPLMLLAIGIFGYIIGSYQTALETIVAFAQNFLPMGTDYLERNLDELSKQSGLLSGLGLVGLLWAGMQVFVILQQVMNIALGVDKHVGFLRARGVALIMVVVAGALFVLSIAITSLLTAIRHYHAYLWGIGPNELQLFWDFVGVLGPMIISILAFSLMYKFLPTENIRTKGPVIGGITAGLLFELAKNAFRWYIMHFAHFNRIYGSLGSVVVLVVWIYYVSLITVLGAEVASVFARERGEIENEVR